ncbi:MAG: hypothetical protein AAGA68_26665 [Pseudomonadota bacterium]
MEALAWATLVLSAANAAALVFVALFLWRMWSGQVQPMSKAVTDEGKRLRDRLVDLIGAGERTKTAITKAGRTDDD